MKMHVYFVVVLTDARLAASVRVNIASFAEKVTVFHVQDDVAPEEVIIALRNHDLCIHRGVELMHIIFRRKTTKISLPICVIYE